MGEDRDWQKQLMGAALMAAARTAIDYVTNPTARDETVKDVRSRLAEVDYTAAARAVSSAIDQLAESSKTAINEAIDSIRENAEGAVEAAAERAQEQLGSGAKKRGKGRLFLGLLLGIGLGFVLLNEDRRNQILDKITGASGPIDTSQWSTYTPADSSSSSSGNSGSSTSTTTEPAAVSADASGRHADASDSVDSQKTQSLETVGEESSSGNSGEETKTT